jgi:hypothetical protein
VADCRFGINADALSEIVLQGDDLRLVQSTAAIIRFRTALTSLLKKALSLLGSQFPGAEKILAQDQKQEFEGGDLRFGCRDWVFGKIFFW